MQFLYPTFLYALAALAIPIIIHLFYFRRFKKVYFTNVKFLKEVKEETSARRKLRNLLVLMMRLLAIAALVMAFAQPFIPQDAEVQKGEKAVSVFVDNSFSMSALSEDVPLLEKAKQRARQIVSAYEVEDRFQILTNDFEGRHQRLVSKEDALSLIDELKISPAVKNLSRVATRQQQALNQSTTDNQAAYIISDFQKNITDLSEYRDTSIDINLIPLQAVQEKNIAIDSAWFDAPVQTINQTNPLLVKIRNYSNEDVENVRLSVGLDGQEKPEGSLKIPAGGSVIDTVNITILRTGWHEAKLTITDYPIQFDDSYYFSFNVAEKIDILVINENTPNKFLDAAFRGIGYFDLTNQPARNLEYSKFPDYQLIILNDVINISSGMSSELSQYVFNGGNVLVFPAQNANIDSYKNFLQTFPANQLEAFDKQDRTVSTLNFEEFIFKDVFEKRSPNMKLPVTQGNFKISNFSSRSEERLMRYRDGSSFLGKYESGQGNLYLCSAPLNTDFNDLVRNADIFIPMLYKMAISSSKDRKIAYVIGDEELLQADAQTANNEMVYKLKGKAEEFIPEQKVVASKVILGINNQISEAGYYNLFLNKDEILDKFAFNFNRQESNLAYFSLADLKSQLTNAKMAIIEANNNTDITQTIGERSRGVVLWRWCVILALIFLALEVLLLRLWKT